MYTRVQRFDASVHHLWKTGVIGNLGHGDSGIDQLPIGAAGR
jgi:hypothetical protein